MRYTGTYSRDHWRYFLCSKWKKYCIINILQKIKELLIPTNTILWSKSYFTFKGLSISVLVHHISACGNYLSSVELSTIANNQGILLTVSSTFFISWLLQHALAFTSFERWNIHVQHFTGKYLRLFNVYIIQYFARKYLRTFNKPPLANVLKCIKEADKIYTHTQF